MKLSAWIGLIAISGCLGLVACSDDSDDGTGTDGGSGTGGSGGGTGGSAGASTGGSAGASTGGTAGASTGGTAGAGTGGSAGGANACADCLETNCKTEDDACTADPECVAINDCVFDTCDPSSADFGTCVQGCIAANPNGAAAFQALLGCAAQSCQAECS